jgi:hypothetical protein
LKPGKTILPINSLHFQLSKEGAILTKKQKKKPNPTKLNIFFSFSCAATPPVAFHFFLSPFHSLPRTGSSSANRSPIQPLFSYGR